MDVIIIPAYNRANYEVWGSCLCRVPWHEVCHKVLCIHACEDMRHWYGDSWKRRVRLFHQKKKKEQRSKQNKYPKNKRLEHELTVLSTKGNMHCLHSLLVYYQSASAQEWLLRKQYTTLLAQFIFVNSPTSPGFWFTVWSSSQDPQTGFLSVLSSC